MSHSLPGRRDAVRNHQRLLAAAREVFAEQAPQASLHEVARRAEMGVGTIYRNYPAKEALLDAVVADGLAALAGQVRGLEGAEPARVFTDALELVLQAQLADRALSAGPPGPRSAEQVEVVIAVVDELLHDAQAAGAVRGDIATADLVRLIRAVGAASRDHPGHSRLLLDVVLHGLLTNSLRTGGARPGRSSAR